MTKLIIAAIAVLAVSSLILATVTPSGRFPDPPIPNGYDDFIKAGESINGDSSTYPDLNQAELQSLVATNAASLQLLRLGLSRHCSVPTMQVLTNFAASSSRLVNLRRLALLTAAQGRLAELEGNLPEAAQCYLADMRLGNEISRGGFYIDRLVGIALEAIGGLRLAKLAPQLTAEQARPVIESLEAIDSRRVSWSELTKNEHVFMRYYLVHNLRQFPTMLRELWNVPQLNRTVENRHQQSLARVRLLATELALCSYRFEKGQAPSRLEDLVPKYLQHVPVDPFNGQAFAYTPQGTNWTLYSVGPPVTKPGASGGGKLFYDSR